MAARVEGNGTALGTGRLEMPADADPGVFIMSDGKQVKKTVSERADTLEELLATYQKSIPPGAKAETTICYGRAAYCPPAGAPQEGKTHAERDDLRHAGVYRQAAARFLSEEADPPGDRQEGSRHVPADLELGCHAWPCRRPGPDQRSDVSKDRTEAAVHDPRGHRKGHQAGRSHGQAGSGLWECLFLTISEVQEVLAYVEKNADHDFIYPMFVFVAHTGARRSEILRAQIDDFDFQSKTVLIREKKRSHDKSLSYRRVRMSELLASTMKNWFAKHPGGQHAICEPVKIIRGKAREVGVPLTRTEAHDHFKRTLAKSKWDKIRGFHVFRHSFASNLAAAGVDQRIID